ncbi:hypothetical protein IAE57_12005 [Stenotrophomonas sp. S48]|uniref:hypothetical protein n=1 Tax=unclassified Stenotrophomonas TaxID=196198 RepID=UPI0018FFC97A|nr:MULTISPECIES: hypothetical protein [unclassified Stenotrophomonas]MBK0026888.1 hypothetical protein [Stenotrophomonas sp. S48]MBK0047265.1 hypothetical protein [Stenotrophomonas sp. S49]
MPLAVHRRFETHLSDPQVYDRLEQHVLDHFMAGIGAARLRAEDFRSPHYNVFFADGTKDREANPIFSAKHLPSGNIIRIVIFESHPVYTEVHNRVGDDNANDELCVFITLSGLERAMDRTVAWAIAANR